MYARQYDRAIAEYLRVLALDPDYEPTYEGLGNAYRLAGRLQEAVDSNLEHLARLGLPADDLDELRRAFDENGLEGYWRAYLVGLERYAKVHYVAPDEYAQKHALVGDADQAFMWLEKAYDERTGMVSHVKASPWFDRIRTDPRFERFVRRVGIPDG